MASRLQEQYHSLEQQGEAATQGLWVFLGSEILFFGGMMLAYTVYRQTYPQAFMEISRELSWIIGTVNTAVLLTSSLTMALAVRSARLACPRQMRIFLILTLALGVAFLVLKGFEYADDFKKHLFITSVTEPSPAFHPRQILLFLYYLMTAVHGLHLLIGIGVVSVLLAGLAREKEFKLGSDIPIEVVGLYWHFVDIIWIFLYPMLYLIGRPVL